MKNIALRVRAGGRPIDDTLLDHIRNRMLDSKINASLCYRDYVAHPNEFQRGYNIMDILVDGVPYEDEDWHRYYDIVSHQQVGS